MFKSMIPFILILVSFLRSSPVLAQPGWIDYTTYYYYSILDESGKEIQFKENEQYTIAIDSLLFSGISIPFDSLKPATSNTRGPVYNYISINDLSIRTPLDPKRNVELKIIKGRDTMHFNQPTDDVFYHGVRAKRTLRFLKGHYYFPDYTQHLYDRLPAFTDEVKLMNVDQRHFLIPAQLYCDMLRWGYDQRLQEKAEAHVFQNFLKPLEVSKKVEEITFNKDFKPFRKARWRGPFYQTEDSNVFYELVSYTLDTNHLSSTQSVFSTFNKSDNSITHWSPKEKMKLFWGAGLIRDTIKQHLYLRHGVRENVKQPCPYKQSPACPYSKKLYVSKDGGQYWEEDEVLQEVYNQYDFRELEFLDEDYALAFRRKTAFHPRHKWKLQRGTYYLLYRKRVVDSLQTPDSVHYNTNYVRYAFSRNKDSVRLGGWGIDSRTPKNSLYSQPWLFKEADTWCFEVFKTSYQPNEYIAPQPDSLLQYDNFQLYNEQKLVFKQNIGSLILSEDSWKQGLRILERDKQIYILQPYSTLMSFDAGQHWYIYPKPLHQYNRYDFLEIDALHQISFFDFTQMEKVTYTFSLKRD